MRDANVQTAVDRLQIGGEGIEKVSEWLAAQCPGEFADPAEARAAIDKALEAGWNPALEADTEPHSNS